jgi:hypothetical protein
MMFMAPVLLGVLAVLVVVGQGPLRVSRSLTAHAWRPVAAQGLTLDIPADAGPPVQDPGDPWSATEFHAASLGTLRVARERPLSELPPALRNWFELPHTLDGPLTYQVHRQPAQVRPVTVFGPSGHQVRREGRLLVAVCVFDQGGQRYWVQIRAPGGSRATLAGFHRVLLSMRGPDGAGVDPGLAGQLRDAEQVLAPGIVQGGQWVAFIPVGVMLLASVLILAVGRWSGRAPKTLEGLGGRYLQAPVEVLIAFQLQRKYFDAAIAVLDDRLVVYTFGSPFLTVPLAVIRGKVTAGDGWFPPPYLEIALEGAQDFRKWGRLYGGWRGRTRLRIYTEDVLRLRAALGA